MPLRNCLFTLGVALLLAASVAALAPSPGLNPRIDDNGSFAAIAFSPQTGRWGVGDSLPGRGAAETEALGRCDARDAKVVVWVRNGYAALALGDARGAYGWGFANDPETACAIALRECAKHTGNCYVAACVGGQK